MSPGIRPARPAACRRTLTPAAFALILGGCSTPTVPFEFSARDAATAEPIVGARVVAQTLHHYHPMAINDIVTSSWRGSFAEGETDASGTVRLEASESRPLRVLIFTDGRGVQTWVFDPPPDRTGWVASDDGGDSPVETRVIRVGAP